MNIDFATLGFTKEELQERVVDRICEQLLSSVDYDPHSGDEYPVASKFQQAIQKRVQEHIHATINAIAEKHVLPNVAEYIQNMTLQETTQWGEKKGAAITFTEYLVQRAKAYMQEQVDTNGKSKVESESSYWSGKQTRITHLIHSHLHHEIENAMKDSLKLATGEIARGLHETTRLKLNEIAAGMKVAVTTK